jgi:hypothetical protein
VRIDYNPINFDVKNPINKQITFKIIPPNIVFPIPLTDYKFLDTLSA